MIREAEESDWPALWPILHEAFADGDTYPFPPDIAEGDAHRAWMVVPTATFVAEQERAIVGTYYLKPNQPGLGSHVCNAGYIVAKSARGRGIGRLMCAHSLDEARRRGFRAMQFNLVVATNADALRLWQEMGFAKIGALPEAFRHAEHGYVDALVMYQLL